MTLCLILVLASVRAHAEDASTPTTNPSILASALAQNAISQHSMQEISPSSLPAPDGAEPSAIAVHLGHESSIGISVGGRIQCVLELERLFNQRYYQPPSDGEQFFAHWKIALEALRDRCECDNGECPSRFDDGLIIPYPWRPNENDEIRQMITAFWPVERWHEVYHHEAHARHGYYASPFQSALIVSMDAGGNDGFLSVYKGSVAGVNRVARLDYNIGAAYNLMASFSPEVTGVALNETCKSFSELSADDFVDYMPNSHHTDNHDAWAGKMMGYAATGEPEVGLVEPIVDVFLRSRAGSSTFRDWKVHTRIYETACKGTTGQQTIAATTQLVFENMVRDIVRRFLPAVGGQRQVDGIVLTGGCALNVLANQRVEDDFGLPVYVPPGSNDAGLPVGALWSIRPPPVVAPLQYLGFRLWDEGVLEHVARRRGARRLSGPEELARILTATDSKSGKMPIVAVVRGRQEFGPRALGHRSLLAVPYSEDVKDRLNRLKHRQWYRPVAPMIAEEALEQVFGRVVKSPYMEKAPAVTEATQRSFPALAHLDGTARFQSVSQQDEPWVHALLAAVGKITGLASLINTSFNIKGKPIVNRVKDCLEMLDSQPDLDYVLIEDWLFSKEHPIKD